jgi:NADPH-dependent ferric siderophore reductase
MAPDRMLELVGQPGGPLADAALWPLEVTDSFSLTPSFRRLVLTAPGLDGLNHQPGQDLMLRVPLGPERVVNRRYTIRSFDPRQKAVTIDVSVHGAGPGTDWISAARPGDHIDAIGPRGKVTVRPEADWHLFVADETGIPGALAMLEALPTGTPAIALLEVDTGADEEGLVAPLAGSFDVRWLHRDGRSVPGDPGPILEEVAAVDLPGGAGHAYVSAEAGVVRAVARALGERGLSSEQISGKAYWRRGLPNAEHGEPTKEG